ncbi:MAG TPA: choice-of-anchor D domain-containing protein [Bacteroidetes bacterium]|nr:choice-of-anchor D domain-containing protein [Bacteroidota bacterium]
MTAHDTVTVRNDGTADLDVTSIALASGTTFTILSGGSATLVTPGDSVSVVVQFAAASEGAFADTLTIASDDADEPSVQVEVTGTGTPPPAPEISVAPDSLGFGEVQQTLTAQDTVLVRNDGTATLSLSSIALASGTVFSILSGGDTASILAGDSAAVVLQFAPGADGLVTDTLTIESDDADTPTTRVVLSGVGTPPPAPVILVTPDSLGFGEVVENTVAQDTVTVRNAGDAPLDVTALSLATGSVFSILEGPAGSVAAGDSLSIVVQFAPLAAGVETDTLTVESDDATQPSARVVLAGTGVPPPAPEISVSADSLGFGGVRTDAVAQDSVRILNEGTADLSLSSIALASGTAFSILAGGDTAVLVPGDSAFVVVQFAPSVAGAQADTLSIASDDADEALVRVELTGTGIGVPLITVTPDSLGLGAVAIGAMTQGTVTVRNEGTGDLSLTSLALSDSTAFTILSGGDPATLAPGDSASVVVQFAPLMEGATSDTLTVLSDDETTPSQTVVVTGTGVGEPEVDADLTPLAFGTVTIGEMPQDTVVVRNLGNGSLAVSSVTISGAAPDAYEVLAGGEGGVVAPGDSLTIVVGFGPILETEQLATLTIATDDADEPTLEIPLSGTGDSPGYVFLYVMGDSQAAGKGDPTTSCDLRPNAGRRGWVYRRAFDEYVPVCDPAVDDLYNGSVLPSLVDEVYEQHNKIALVIFYTIKGTNLTPEAAGDELYWYIGDDSTAAGQAFDNGKIVLKKAKRAAQRDFAGQPVEPLAGIHSFGGLDARKWYEQGLGGPETSFRPRLSFFDFVISASNVQPLYFEIARAPGKPQFDAPLDTFAAVMRDVVPADRVLDYADYVNAQEAIDQLGYGEANWWADKSGHLGSRGLDYLGTVIAQAIDP